MTMITPEIFNTVAVGVGALLVAGAAIGGMLLTNRSNKKNREQVAKIAADQADAIRMQARETAKIAMQTHEIKVSIDGRMDELLVMTRELAKAKAEAVAAAAASTLRDSNVVSQVAGAVVERIGEAVDRAAQTIPASK